MTHDGPTIRRRCSQTSSLYLGIGPGMHALEIGIGTGLATQPFLDTGCHVTAIELGKDLATYVRQKFSAFEVINTDFADWPGATAGFDLVYSATAFH